MARLIDLTDKRSIEAYTLLRWRVPYFVAYEGATPEDYTMRFCDSRFVIQTRVYTLPELVTLSEENFAPLGILLNVTDTTSELRATPSGITFTLTAFTEILGYDMRQVFFNSKIPGTTVEMWRLYRDVGTRTFTTDEPIGRFQGVVSNFSIEEEFIPGSQLTQQTLVVQCNSTVEQLSNKIAGCRTNSADRKAFYDDGAGHYDVSMDRVVSLKDSNFNFGAPG